MTVKGMRRALVGRKIVGFEARAFRDGVLPVGKGGAVSGLWGEGRPSGGRITYDPLLVLDDGTRLSFRVHETETGEYGIDPVIIGRKGSL